MKKMRCLLLSLLIFQLPVKSQCDFIRKGLLSGEATFSPGYMLNNGAKNFYLNGRLDAYLSDKISITGESFYYLGTPDDSAPPFIYNHTISAGISRHFTFNRSDFYAGLRPGLAFTKLSDFKAVNGEGQAGVNPVFSLVAGYNLFISSCFHFFISTVLAVGEHNYDTHTSLSELRVAGGLGFNINTFKCK